MCSVEIFMTCVCCICVWSALCEPTIAIYWPLSIAVKCMISSCVLTCVSLAVVLSHAAVA